MTAKEYLRQLRGMEVEIEAKIEQRAQLKWIIDQTDQRTDEQSARIHRQYIEADEKLKERVEQLMARQREIRTAIEQVQDETLRKILEYRYINGWSLLKISRRMYISYDWVRHLHGAALLKVKIPEST